MCCGWRHSSCKIRTIALPRTVSVSCLYRKRWLHHTHQFCRQFGNIFDKPSPASRVALTPMDIRLSVCQNYGMYSNDSMLRDAIWHFAWLTWTFILWLNWAQNPTEWGRTVREVLAPYTYLFSRHVAYFQRLWSPFLTTHGRFTAVITGSQMGKSYLSFHPACKLINTRFWVGVSKMHEARTSAPNLIMAAIRTYSVVRHVTKSAPVGFLC